jgi:hypothetical protein
MTVEIEITCSELCRLEGAIEALLNTKLFEPKIRSALERLHNGLEYACIQEVMKQNESETDGTAAVAPITELDKAVENLGR